MKEISNNFNKITGIKVTGIKVNKVLIIIFFILAGGAASLFSNKDVSSEIHKQGLSFEICLNDYSIEQTIAKKEYKCSSGLEIRTNGDVSKSITQFYNQLKSTFNKMLNT